MKTLNELYREPSNLVSFEGLKKELKEFPFCQRAMCFKDKIYISFIKKEKDQKIMINTKIMGELVKLEKHLALYYGKANVVIYDDKIAIFIGQ